MTEMVDQPGEELPKPRRTLLERLCDWLVPPTAWEAEGRYLRLQVAERVRVRTALQDRRTKAMEARKLQRDTEEQERLDGAVQHGVFSVTFLDSGVEYVLTVVMEQLVNRGNVRELRVRSVSRSDRLHLPSPLSDELIRSRVQADHKYIKFARPWKDGLLSTKALRKLCPAGFVFPEVSSPEVEPTTDTLLSAELERLNNMVTTLAEQLQVYQSSRSLLDYIAEWERANGTLACIMSEEVGDFVAGLQRAAAKSSVRATAELLNKQNRDREYHVEKETWAASAIMKRLRDRIREEDDYVQKV